MSTLRGRFILSHMLPLLILVPLMGLALIYVLETQVLLDNLSTELMGQARLIAEMTEDRSAIWSDPAQAQVFVTYLDTYLDTRVMLLGPDGYLLASSDPADADRLGQPLETGDWASVLAGETSARTVYSQQQHYEIVEVLLPVMSANQQIAGAVRLSQRLSDVHERFLRLRQLISGVLIGGLILGVLVGGILALNLERPLRRVTQAIYQLSSGERLAPLPERGPREIRQLSASVNALVERLHAMDQARRQLLANLVHELGRPLGALRSVIDALLGGADEEASLRQELLAGMEDEVDRLRRLLDDLAGLHDQVLGTLELNRQPTDLRAWLEHTLGPWREDAQSKGLHWQTDLPDVLPTLSIDPDRLGQSVGNLLSNAIKFTPSGGTVSVEAGVERDALWIRVGDTGAGIDPEAQEHIFEPFYRSQAGRRFPQGMGLGLTIARDLVAAHGGRLEVDSTPGMGSRFTLWLPLDLAES